MSVPYTSYEAQVIQAIITMVATSATFQTLTSTVTPAAAKAYIIELDGGDEDEVTGGTGRSTACDNSTLNRLTAACWAHVCERPPELNPESHAWLTWSRSGEITVRIWSRRTTSDTPPERRRRMMNIIGSIRADLEALFTAAGCLPAGQITSRLEALPDDTGYARDLDSGLLTIHWRSLP